MINNLVIRGEFRERTLCSEEVEVVEVSLTSFTGCLWKLVSGQAGVIRRELKLQFTSARF